MTDTPSRCEPPEEWRVPEAVRRYDLQRMTLPHHVMSMTHTEICEAARWAQAEIARLHGPALPDAAAEIEKLRAALAKIASEKTYDGIEAKTGLIITTCKSCGARWRPKYEKEFHFTSCAASIARAALARKRAQPRTQAAEDGPYIERWDDGSELLLLGYAGGADPNGFLSFLDTVFVKADGTEEKIRFVRERTA